MSGRITLSNVTMVAMLAIGAVGFTSGCASRKYVRTRVDDSAQTLSARLDKDEEGINNNIKANTTQIEELNGVTRDHTQKISALDNNVKQTDTKAQQALTTGQTAQQAASKAADQVSALDTRFQNRNHYVSLKEEQVRFKFNSAKLEDSSKQVLDDIAQQLKQNPDAILVLEGHTDATGPDAYNIQLGERRAEAVKRYLAVDQGVPINRVSDISFGEAKPLNPEKGRKARAENRAVVLRVMGPEGGKQGMVSQSSTMQ